MDGLEKRFSKLADRAGNIVLVSKTYHDVETFRTLIKPHGSTEQKHYKTFFGKKYLQGTTIQKLWDRLKCHWNYLNFSLLQRVVSVIGEKDLEKEMDAYAADVAEFHRSTLLCDFHEYLHTLDVEVDKKLLCDFTSKHKMKWEECTLEHLEDKKKLITCIFFLPKYAMLLKKFKKGCVSITWSLPCLIACDLKEDIENMDRECFKMHQIVAFDFDGKKCVYLVTKNYASFLKEKYLPESKEEKYISEFRLAQISKQRAERCQMDDSMKPSIRGRIDDIDYAKTPLTEEKLNDQLSSMSQQKQDLRLVLIEGTAGVGKTTFSKHFCHKWALGKSMQQYSLVILLPLRDIQVKSALVISDLFCWCDHSQQQKLVREVEDNQGEGVAFWFEGWDELDENLRTKSSIFLDLINGKVLPKATVFVTSRHWASKTITKKLKRSDLHIEILSLPEEQINSVLKKRKEEWDPTVKHKFVEYTRQRSNVAIYAAMHTSVTADIAADVFQWSVKANLPPPSTVTQLYTMYVYKILTKRLPTSAIENYDVHCFDYLPDDVRKKFDKLCKTAFNGIENRQFVFDDPELKEASLGLLEEADQLYSEHKSSYNFIHTTVQEYLAAVYISKMQKEVQTKLFQEFQRSHHVMHGHFQMPLRFVAGLTCLESLIEEDKKGKLFSRLLQSDPLTVFHWLFETGNVDIIGTVLSKLKVTVGSKRSWIPLDFFVTGHCLSFSECEWSFEFSQLSGGNELKMFFQGVVMNTEASRHCTGYISRLTFRSVKFQTDVIDLLAKLPARMLHGLTALELSSKCEWPSNRNITNVLADAVPEIHSLKELSIFSPIIHGGAVKLLQALHTSNTTLSHLDLSNSNIGDEDCEFVGKLLATSTSLTTFRICQISQKSVFSILKGLRTNHTLQELRLSMSPFSHESMELLSSLLEDPQFKLRDLYIDECLINVPQTIELARALSHNQSLKYLNLSYNIRIGEDHPDYDPQDNPRGVKAIADMLAQNTCLEGLILHKCRITSEGAILLVDVLIKTNSTLNSLNIAQNLIGSDGALKLAELIRENRSLRWIRFENNPSVTLDNCYRLYDAMKNNSTLELITFPAHNESSFNKLLKEQGEKKDKRIGW